LSYLWCSSKLYPIKKRALTLNTKQAVGKVVEYTLKINPL